MESGRTLAPVASGAETTRERRVGARSRRASAAVITHNAAIAAMADRVIRLSGGEIVEVRGDKAKGKPAGLEWRRDEYAHWKVH
jgi:hypothetical protein